MLLRLRLTERTKLELRGPRKSIAAAEADGSMYQQWLGDGNLKGKPI